MNNKAYKEARMQNLEGMEISANLYNLIIGLVVMSGIFVNAMMAKYLTEPIVAFSAILLIVLYLAVSFSCIIIIYRSKNPIISYIAFLGLAAAMGLILVRIISDYSQSNITTALLITGITTIALMAASSIFPQFFLSIGRGLGIALLITIIVEVIFRVLLGFPMDYVDYIVAVIFCGYIGYDWAKAQAYPKTYDNAVDSAADIYVDVANLFIRILEIVGRSDN